MLTKTDCEFIRQNYLSLGATDCARHLNRSLSAVRKHAKRFGLALTHTHRSNIMIRKLDKPPDKRNVNHLPFTIPEKMTPVNIYLLGFIWADGHISFRKSACSIEARFVTDDASDILPLFQQTGKWGVYTQTPMNCREATIVNTNNRPFAEFLNKMDYVTKSNASAKKILDFVPEHFIRYWWLGYVDGDGCFYIGKKGQEISMSSGYDQDWSYFEQLSGELGLEYHLNRRKNSHSSCSEIRIVKKESCAKFIRFLYPEGYEFGLKRKYNKAEEILKKCTTYIKPGPKGPWKHQKGFSTDVKRFFL